jgi:hypothetical protein
MDRKGDDRHLASVEFAEQSGAMDEKQPESFDWEAVYGATCSHCGGRYNPAEGDEQAYCSSCGRGRVDGQLKPGLRDDEATPVSQEPERPPPGYEYYTPELRRDAAARRHFLGRPYSDLSPEEQRFIDRVWLQEDRDIAAARARRDPGNNPIVWLVAALFNCGPFALLLVPLALVWAIGWLVGVARRSRARARRRRETAGQ